MADTTRDQYVSERYEPMKDSYDTLAMRLDPTPTLMLIKRLLQHRTIYNKNTDDWERPPNTKPMLSEDGIEEVMIELSARMSVDKALSKLTENQIREIEQDVGLLMVEFIYFNHEKYKINESNYNRILWLVFHNVGIFLRRALNGQENELITRGFIHKELVSKVGRMDSDQDMGEKKPFYSGFSLFGGKR